MMLQCRVECAGKKMGDRIFGQNAMEAMTAAVGCIRRLCFSTRQEHIHMSSK